MFNFRIVLSLICLIILFLLVVVLFITVYLPASTSFNINVQTEIVEFNTIENPSTNIYLTKAIAYLNNGDSIEIKDGNLSLKGNVNVVVERVSQGPLAIRLQSISSSGLIGNLINGDSGKVVLLKDDVWVSVINIDKRIARGEVVLIPFFGKVVIGRNIGFKSTSGDPGILRSGEITMLDKSILGNKFFESGKHLLSLGERVEVEKPDSEAIGFIHLSENPAMRVNCRISGKKAKIIKPGPIKQEVGINISTSLYYRFLRDEFFQALSLMMAFIIALYTLTEPIQKLFNWLKTISERRNNIVN